MTKQQLARRLGPGNYRRIARATGYTHVHISRVLRGLNGVSLEAATEIAIAADVGLSDLFEYIKRQREAA